MTLNNDHDGGQATDAEARIARDLAWDPSCPFRHESGHTCARRDGRSVGTLGAHGDCYEGASFGAYHGSLEASRSRHPSAYEPDVAYLLQQSLIDQAESALLGADDPSALNADYFGSEAS